MLYSDLKASGGLQGGLCERLSLWWWTKTGGAVEARFGHI